MRLALIFILISAAAPAPVTQQFDLLCTGLQETIIPASLTDETKSVTSEYRVDLSAKRWCEGECSVTFQIDEVQPSFISLEQKTRDRVNDKPEVMVQVNRTTGDWHIYTADNVLTITTKGNCTPAPFKGFPVPKTKI